MTAGRGAAAPTRRQLWFATGATFLAAVDTYVVVLAIPAIAVSVRIDITDLQRIAPVVSTFLLAYVCALPLAGRLSDRCGRVPVLVACLAVFAIGSMVTAAASDLPTVEIGRLLQGAGGGGLVPVTIALVADLYPRGWRGLPLGIVGAVQETGAVVGPLIGAGIVALGSWRLIFVVNLAAAAVLMIALNGRRFVRDWLGLAIGIATLALLALTLWAPADLTARLTLGRVWVPIATDSRWLSPIALTTLGLVVVFLLRQFFAPTPLLRIRVAPALLRELDLVGAALLAVVLAAITYTFSTTDPAVQAVSPNATWLVPVGTVALIAFVIHQRRAAHPLIPRAVVRPRGAWVSLVVSGLVGVCLITVLVNVPLYVRVAQSGSTQLDAALVLFRFLIAVPLGALTGGWLLHRRSAAVVTTAGLILLAGGLSLMAQWGPGAADQPLTVSTLLLAGFAFGLVLAPVNEAILAATPEGAHGVASALIIGARTIGMVVGLSALTGIGVHRYQDNLRTLGTPTTLCPDDPAHCPAYSDGLRAAALDQLQVVFGLAAGVALLAAGVAVGLHRSARPMSA